MVGYVLAYACWILVAIGSILTVLRIRSAFDFIWIKTGGDWLALVAIDRLGMVFLSLAALAYGVLAEDRFRTSIDVARAERVKTEVRSSDQREDLRESKVATTLKRWGLGILARRFAVTVTPLLVVLVLTYLGERLPYLWLAGPR